MEFRVQFCIHPSNNQVLVVIQQNRTLRIPLPDFCSKTTEDI